MEKRLAAQQWYPPIVSIMKQELAAGRLRLRNIMDRVPLPVWQTQGVTLLGDAGTVVLAAVFGVVNRPTSIFPIDTSHAPGN